MIEDITSALDPENFREEYPRYRRWDINTFRTLLGPLEYEENYDPYSHYTYFIKKELNGYHSYVYTSIIWNQQVDGYSKNSVKIGIVEPVHGLYVQHPNRNYRTQEMPTRLKENIADMRENYMPIRTPDLAAEQIITAYDIVDGQNHTLKIMFKIDGSSEYLDANYLIKKFPNEDREDKTVKRLLDKYGLSKEEMISLHDRIPKDKNKQTDRFAELNKTRLLAAIKGKPLKCHLCKKPDQMVNFSGIEKYSLWVLTDRPPLGTFTGSVRPRPEEWGISQPGTVEDHPMRKRFMDRHNLVQASDNVLLYHLKKKGIVSKKEMYKTGINPGYFINDPIDDGNNWVYAPILNKYEIFKTRNGSKLILACQFSPQECFGSNDIPISFHIDMGKFADQLGAEILFESSWCYSEPVSLVAFVIKRD